MTITCINVQALLAPDGLVVKSPAWCRELKIHQQNPSWMPFGLDIKLAGPCTSAYAGQVKYATKFAQMG